MKLDYLMNSVVSKHVEGKSDIRNEQKLPEGKYWQEIFRHFKNNDIPLENITAVVELSLSLQGIDADVERTFPLLTSFGRLTQMFTAKSTVLVKHHIRKCTKFHELSLTQS